MNLYNIFDPDRGQYWKIGLHGYTCERDNAHRFQRAEAEEICEQPNVNDYMTSVDTAWTHVGCYKDVPEGLWLVKLDSTKYKEYQVMNCNPTVSTIGSHFAHDEGRVLAYKPLGELL